MLKLGYKASAEQFAPRELVEFAVQAEQAGLDSVWISDHFQPWRHTGGHAPFSLVWLAAVGERTQHVLLGTSVLTPTGITRLWWRTPLQRLLASIRAARRWASAAARQ